ncbi:ATPase [Sulfitobacter alexandrii]|uniref:ATPase n=1 Tax=Sulfitobacter alexandrii TaxID=1917485 RepID=A0A1J0WIM8_9RHOB|nr:AAA family ATPase [Sulfitobacter alexandrii]APE44024.1 ATPase [Sulfitobacter alexandrii]
MSDRRDQHVILSGCSGGGKTTLLAELARRGHATVPEPGRRIVAEEMACGGTALPWTDLAAFARRALALATADRAALEPRKGWVFFDRGVIDAAVALSHATGQPLATLLQGQPLFHPRVFLVPPWREIFEADAERRHDMEEGLREYHRLKAAYRRLGYDPLVLPRTSTAMRADLVLDRLGPPPV